MMTVNQELERWCNLTHKPSKLDVGLTVHRH